MRAIIRNYDGNYKKKFFSFRRMKVFSSCNFDIRFFPSTLGALSRPTSNLKFSFKTRFDRAVLYFEGKVFLRVVSETGLRSRV